MSCFYSSIDKGRAQQYAFLPLVGEFVQFYKEAWCKISTMPETNDGCSSSGLQWPGMKGCTAGGDRVERGKVRWADAQKWGGQ